MPRKYEFHPVAEMLPPMTAEEYMAFRDNIWKRGLIDPIELYEGKIIDGRHRYLACQEIKIDPEVVELDLEPDQVVEYVLSKNLHRRHLNTSQRAWLATQVAKAKAAEAKVRQVKALCKKPDWDLTFVDVPTQDAESLTPAPGKAPEASAKVREQGKAAEIAAKQFKVSPRTVEHALSVDRKGVTPLKDALRDGTIAVKKAAEIAELSPRKQEKALAEALTGPKRAANPPKNVCACKGVCPCHKKSK